MPAVATVRLLPFAIGLGVVPSGCLALPFAAPPTSVSVVGGAAMGSVTEPDNPSAGIGKGAIDGRVGVRPLGFVDGLQDRKLGFAAGYVFEALLDDELGGETKHGGYAALTHYPWISEPSAGGWYSRFGINAMPEVLVRAADGEVGGGFSISVDLERYTHGEGAFAGFGPDGGVAGGAYGEGGIGVELSTGVRSVGRTRYWMAGLGITFRLPAVAGVLLVPLKK